MANIIKIKTNRIIYNEHYHCVSHCGDDAHGMTKTHIAQVAAGLPCQQASYKHIVRRTILSQAHMMSIHGSMEAGTGASFTHIFMHFVLYKA